MVASGGTSESGLALAQGMMSGASNVDVTQYTAVLQNKRTPTLPTLVMLVLVQTWQTLPQAVLTLPNRSH